MKTPKKPVNKVILPVRQAPPAVSNAEKVAALMSLQASEGWALVLSVLNENKTYLERMILRGCDPETGEKLTSAEQDEARYKLELTESVMDTPAKYIANLEASGDGPVDYDPYSKNVTDMINAEK